MREIVALYLDKDTIANVKITAMVMAEDPWQNLVREAIKKAFPDTKPKTSDKQKTLKKGAK